MFQIAVSETFWTVVRVEVPGDNGNKKVHTFKAQFKRLNQEELDAMQERLMNGDLSDQKLIDEVMVGWAEVMDMERNPLPFTPDNLAALLNIHPTRICIAKAYYDVINAAVRKN